MQTTLRHVTLCCIAFFLVAVPVTAADWYVSPTGDDANDGSEPAPWISICYAVGNTGVADGDTIHLAAGTYYESNITVNKSLSLAGAEGGLTVIDGMKKGRVLIVDTPAGCGFIEDLTVYNGSTAYGPGGGICLLNGTLTIDRCTLANNGVNMRGDGGGVYVRCGNMTIAHSGITDNIAIRGGGVFLQDGAMTLSECTLSGNDALYGAGFYQRYGASTITGCTLTNNTGLPLKNGPPPLGGGVNMWSGSLALSRCTFTGNAADSGGGVYQHDGILSITECTITENSATGSSEGVYGSGGGVYQFGGILTVTGCTLTGNVAEHMGGGFHQWYGVINAPHSQAEITDCVIAGNTADLGGGIFHNGGALEIDGCNISENAASQGGGVYQHAESLILSGSVIAGNTADQCDGVLHYGGFLSLFDCILCNDVNFEYQGGTAVLNTTVTTSTNILGGLYLGGNYWSNPSGTGYSDLCTDTDGDGFCDTPYTVSGITDLLPLTPLPAFSVPTPAIAPVLIPVNTDGSPGWGESATLSVVETGSDVSSVTVNLTPLGGMPSVVMAKGTGQNRALSVSSAVPSPFLNGSYQPVTLYVTATGTDGNPKMTVGIPLTVVRNGDVNEDGRTTLYDAIYIARHTLRINGSLEMYESVGDVDGDGTVQLTDAAYLARHVLAIPGYDPLH